MSKVYVVTMTQVQPLEPHVIQQWDASDVTIWLEVLEVAQ